VDERGRSRSSQHDVGSGHVARRIGQAEKADGVLCERGGGDVAPLANDTTSRPTSGPMTRARAKAIHDKVNSLLTTLDLDTPLDGMLPHAETLCVIRYVEHQDPGEDDTPW
jgi:hypothetical protein